MSTKVTCPICQKQGVISYARRIAFNPVKRMVKFECFEDPAHTFELSIDEVKK